MFLHPLTEKNTLQVPHHKSAVRMAAAVNYSVCFRLTCEVMVGGGVVTDERYDEINEFLFNS